jgi:hypothetical protein
VFLTTRLKLGEVFLTTTCLVGLDFKVGTAGVLQDKSPGLMDISVQCTPARAWPTFQALPPAHSANASYVGLPVAPAARISIQLVASLAHATTNMVKHPTRTPVLEMANGMGKMELQ